MMFLDDVLDNGRMTLDDAGCCWMTIGRRFATAPANALAYYIDDG